MKLTVADKLIVLPEDGVISIERSSPYLNDDTGSFSFPFPVPTLPNQKNLGWPGKLQRDGDIPDQSFIREENGVQVFRGEVDYDEITADQIGMILKSGNSEFTGKMEGKKLGAIDYGSEWWPVSHVGSLTGIPSIYDKLLEWDEANTTNNGKYVVSPFWLKDYEGNRQLWHGSGTPSYLALEEITVTEYYPYYGIVFLVSQYGLFCLQFRVPFMLHTIFESAGYVIVEDVLSSSEFNRAIFFSNMMAVLIRPQVIGDGVRVSPRWATATLEYSSLMPDIAVLDFLKAVKDMFGLVYEIDELRKEVRIKFKSDVFMQENLDAIQITELKGWIHKEKKALKGFALRYASQDDDNATKYEYEITATVASTLPSPPAKDDVYHVTATNRDYIVVADSLGTLSWIEYGRLKEYREGEGENVVELNVKVPTQKQYSIGAIENLECPYIPSLSKPVGTIFLQVPMIITLYHGRKTFGVTSYPYASFDQYSISGAIDTEMSLKPKYLYDTVYSKFLNWLTYQARACTKYIEISLLQLVNLQWGKRYMIGGVQVILDKMSYAHPFEGKMEIDGFTAGNASSSSNSSGGGSGGA